VSGGFNNPIIGGGGGLVYPSIHSPNFLTGVSGWTINKDGSAEFNAVVVRGTITAGHFIGTGSGLEVVIYSGPPAAGNLLASMVSSQTTDSFGNAILEGFAVYGQGGGTLTAARIQETGISYYTAATQAGPWTIQASVDYDPTAPASLTISAPLLNIVNAVAVKAGGGGIFKVLETGGAPASPPTQLIAHAAAERVLGIQVLADTAFRLRVDSNGRHDWGDGTTTDTALYRASANLLAVDPIAANIAGAAETWHTLGALGAHYTVTLGRYKLTPEGELELDINVVGDGLQATSVSFANNLPAAYRPATQHDTLPMGTTRQVTAGDIWPRLTVTAAGAVTVINQGTANTFACCVRIPLD
jgi:hypothetical protein